MFLFCIDEASWIDWYDIVKPATLKELAPYDAHGWVFCVFHSNFIGCVLVNISTLKQLLESKSETLVLHHQLQVF